MTTFDRITTCKVVQKCNVPKMLLELRDSLVRSYNSIANVDTSYWADYHRGAQDNRLMMLALEIQDIEAILHALDYDFEVWQPDN